VVSLSWRYTSAALTLFLYFQPSVYSHMFLGAFLNLRKATINFVMSVCPHAVTRHPMEGFARSFVFECILKLSRKFKFHKKLTRRTGTYMKNQYTLLIVPRSVLQRTRNVTDKSCREDQNTHFLFNNRFPRKSWSVWENVEKYWRAILATDNNIIRRMCNACCIYEATETLRYVIVIAFPL
jgi:hypothetical protein